MIRQGARLMKSLMYRQVDSFDGQTITVDDKPCYELGGFLGGGAAGVVYEVGMGSNDQNHIHNYIIPT